MNRYMSILFCVFSSLCLVRAQTVLTNGTSEPLSTGPGWNAAEINVTAVLKKDRPRNGMSHACWGIAWKDANGVSDSLKLQWGNTDFGSDGDKRFLRVSCGRDSKDVSAIHPGQETIALSIILDRYEVEWCVGQDRILCRGASRVSSAPDITTLQIFSIGKDLVIDKLDVHQIEDPTLETMTTFTSASDFVSPADVTSSPMGVWRYLDRDNNPAWSRPGGKYTIGITADNAAENTWHIIYLDGAVTNSDRWQPGMKKGHLKGSGFLRDYNLEWRDAMHNELGAEDECSARLSEDGMILTFIFPLDKATLRFSRQR